MSPSIWVLHRIHPIRTPLVILLDLHICAYTYVYIYIHCIIYLINFKIHSITSMHFTNHQFIAKKGQHTLFSSFFQQFTLETSQVSVPFVRKMKPPKSKAKSKGAGAPRPLRAGSSDIRSSPPLEPPGMREFNAAPNGYPHLLIGRLMVLYIVRSWYSHTQQDFKLETNMHLGSDHKSVSASKDWLQPQTWLACRRTISNKKGHMQEDKSCRSQPCPSWPNRTWSRNGTLQFSESWPKAQGKWLTPVSSRYVNLTPPAAIDFKEVAGLPVLAMVLQATSAMKSPRWSVAARSV